MSYRFQTLHANSYISCYYSESVGTLYNHLKHDDFLTASWNFRLKNLEWQMMIYSSFEFEPSRILDNLNKTWRSQKLLDKIWFIQGSYQVLNDYFYSFCLSVCLKLNISVIAEPIRLNFSWNIYTGPAMVLSYFPRAGVVPSSNK